MGLWPTPYTYRLETPYIYIYIYIGGSGQPHSPAMHTAYSFMICNYLVSHSFITNLLLRGRKEESSDKPGATGDGDSRSVLLLLRLLTECVLNRRRSKRWGLPCGHVKKMRPYVRPSNH